MFCFWVNFTAVVLLSLSPSVSLFFPFLSFLSFFLIKNEFKIWRREVTCVAVPLSLIIRMMRFFMGKLWETESNFNNFRSAILSSAADESTSKQTNKQIEKQRNRETNELKAKCNLNVLIW